MAESSATIHELRFTHRKFNVGSIRVFCSTGFMRSSHNFRFFSFSNESTGRANLAWRAHPLDYFFKRAALRISARSCADFPSNDTLTVRFIVRISKPVVLLK